MNKKLVTLILVILISFCFLSISVADNVIHDDDNSHIYGKTIDKDKKIDKNKTNDKNKATDKNKTDNKSKNGHILAKGKGNDIRFSDGFRGFRLDYSKPPASPGDEFKRASSSSASNANTLKLAIIECYKQDSAGQIGKIMSDFIKSGSSNSKVGEAVAASHEKASGYVKINNNTVAIFSFEVLKSVSGNESDYFAYTVSFASIGDEKDLNQTNLTKSNVTNTTNSTMFNPTGNGTNSTLLDNFYDNLNSFINALYGAWKPIVDTLMNSALMFVNAIEGLAAMFEGLFMEIQSLMDALGKLLAMLESIWDQLEGILKLFAILLNLIDQIISLIESILNFIAELIAAIIALIQQLLELLFALLQFLIDLIEQLLLLLQAILDFLKSLGSFLLNVIENAVIIISAFVIITIGAFIYNRIR